MGFLVVCLFVGWLFVLFSALNKQRFAWAIIHGLHPIALFVFPFRLLCKVPFHVEYIRTNVTCLSFSSFFLCLFQFKLFLFSNYSPLSGVVLKSKPLAWP
eukprot:m.361680 g.361680  ORF g.361680 m.361680 type:complete len:100 (-) comp19773_c0_seq1:124-423(-)